MTTLGDYVKKNAIPQAGLATISTRYGVDDEDFKLDSSLRYGSGSGEVELPLDLAGEEINGKFRYRGHDSFIDIEFQ
jgi:hypothetical protein